MTNRARVRAADLVRAVDQVLPAVSHDRKRPVLQCVRIEGTRLSLRLVATDAARLAVSDVALLEKGASFTALVDAGALAPLRAQDQRGDAVVTVDADRLTIAIGDQTLAPDVVVGEFPNYEPFLAAVADAHTVVVDRDAFVDAIEGLDDDQPVAVRFTAGAIELADARLAVTYDGTDVAFVINPAFAHDAAQAVTGPELAIEAAGPTSPVVFRSAGDDDGYIGVVMPVRIAEPRPRRSAFS